MATPAGNDRFLTDLDIRIWMRDTDPAANTLLDDLEFTAEEMRTAQTLTVDYWNEQPPNIGTFDYTKFPWRGKLLQGTAANLLFIAAHRFRRNSLKYSAGGTAVADQEKAPEYDAAGQKLWEEYKAWVTIQKRALNAERGFGIIH